jgi:hypothetical protein
MKNLEAYINDKNRWRRVFGQTEINTDLHKLSTKEAADLFYNLGADLSPENLSCDGELRGRALLQKAALLKGAVRELEALGYTAPADAYF